MPRLSVEQKTVKALLSDNRANFLIPDYQRPYAWEEKECQTLWDDLFAFAIPEGDHRKFARNDEYFLGPIVTFTNENEQQEVIDGQQRIITLVLLLRAFYTKYGQVRDVDYKQRRQDIEPCIWETDEFGTPNKNSRKIETEVATDEAKQDFKYILQFGVAIKEHKSLYAENYRFFQEKIDELHSGYPSSLAYFSTRILNNCVLLPIEADSSDTALRIFSNLNDRGKPLSDSDIFKAQLYKYYAATDRKDDFVKKWKNFEEECVKVFTPINNTPVDEAFTRYMYYERAKQRNKNTTTEGLRKFYEKSSYALLKNNEAFTNIVDLTNFWKSISLQDKERFSDRILKRLFVLNYAPNNMWANLLSVYYMKNRDSNGMLDDEKFYCFLNKITGFIWAYAFIKPGLNALKTPIFAAMVDIIDGNEINFNGYKLDIEQLKHDITTYTFSNLKPLTKSMLAWWAFNDEKQPLLSSEIHLEIEHIFPKNRQEQENGLSDPQNIESLGNKSLLEKRINIRASDYRFADKKEYYEGKRKNKEKTKILELLKLAELHDDFTETDIVQRNALIIQKFIEYLKDNDLIKQE